MAKAVGGKKGDSTGTTKLTQMRLKPETIAKLDDLVTAMGAATRTEVVRRLIHDAYRKVVRA